MILPPDWVSRSTFFHYLYHVPYSLLIITWRKSQCYLIGLRMDRWAVMDLQWKAACCMSIEIKFLAKSQYFLSTVLLSNVRLDASCYLLSPDYNTMGIEALECTWTHLSRVLTFTTLCSFIALSEWVNRIQMFSRK